MANRWLSGASLTICLSLNGLAQAQILPDNTLPENSIVPAGCLRPCLIEGGTQRGANLFHSFTQFSIQENGTAVFLPDPGIERIFTRVTGSRASEVNGNLIIPTAADFFLLNPNGILLGPRARLTLGGGSFVGTTAESLRFKDGFEFSTQQPTAPLLTLSLPIGLNFGRQPGAIQRQASSTEFPLQVAPEQTLALIGGPVQIEGGTATGSQVGKQLIARDGRIEIGAVRDNAKVGLEAARTGWKLNYEDVRQFEDVQISRGALLKTEGSTGGDIQLVGREISLSDGSQVTIVGSSQGFASDLVVRASDSLRLVSQEGDSSTTGFFNRVRGDVSGSKVFGPGVNSTARIKIETPRLLLLGGAQISTGTFGTGRSPDIWIDAAESVQIVGSRSLDSREHQSLGNPSTDGPSAPQPSGILAIVEKEATGSGGDLFLTTPNLSLELGGQISSSTRGAGKAGNLRIRTQDLAAIGTTADSRDPSGFFAQVEQGASGQGGMIAIQADRLELSDGAQISAAARSSGLGGQVEITAREVLVRGTAAVTFASEAEFSRSKQVSNIAVSTEAGGERAAGSLTLNSETLIVESGGRISGDNFGTGRRLTDGTGAGDRGANLNLNVDRLIVRDGGQIRTASFSAGLGGTLNLEADTVQIEDVGAVGMNGLAIPSALLAQAESTGNAGNINLLKANVLSLNQGLIQTRSAGQGLAGNITAQNLKTLRMENGSLILADAGGNIDGGNITLEAQFVLSRPGRNNDIIANAVGGDGGQIEISQAEAIFNFELNDEPNVRLLRGNRSNDISASSQFGTSGLLSLSGLNVDPSRGLSELPTGIVDESQAIAQRCAAQASSSRSGFYVTGRGGLSRRPGTAEASEFQTSRIRELPSQSLSKQALMIASSEPSSPLQEAESWQIQEDGTVELLAGKAVGAIAPPC